MSTGFKPDETTRKATLGLAIISGILILFSLGLKIFAYYRKKKALSSEGPPLETSAPYSNDAIHLETFQSYVPQSSYPLQSFTTYPDQNKSDQTLSVPYSGSFSQHTDASGVEPPPYVDAMNHGIDRQ